jgi:DNA polymerase III alpha subunit
MNEKLVTFDEDGLAYLTNQGIIELAYQDKLDCIFEWADQQTKQEYLHSALFLDNIPFDLSNNIDMRDRNWFTPDDYTDIDLYQYVMSRCVGETQISRAKEELAIVESLNAEHIFKHLIYLVDQWRSQDLVWGVGRGSSVSCFLLFVIGVNKINPLDYDLDHHEFFKIK